MAIHCPGVTGPGVVDPSDPNPTDPIIPVDPTDPTDPSYVPGSGAADAVNYKDKLLQAYGLEFGTRYEDPSASFGSVEWPDVLNSALLKPEDNATIGAEFDKNIWNLADTHNIQYHAVTEQYYVNVTTYDAGTERMTATFNLSTEFGPILFLVSGLIDSNNNCTAGSGTSDLIFNWAINGAEQITGGATVIKMPAQVSTSAAQRLTFSDTYVHDPSGSGDTVFIATEDSDYLMTESDNYLVADKLGYSSVPSDYSISVEYSADADGNRGEILHMFVWAVILKR